MIGITIAYAQRPICATSLVCYRQLANVAETQTINSLDQHAVLWTRPTKISCRDNVPSAKVLPPREIWRRRVR